MGPWAGGQWLGCYASGSAEEGSTSQPHSAPARPLAPGWTHLLLVSGKLGPPAVTPAFGNAIGWGPLDTEGGSKHSRWAEAPRVAVLLAWPHLANKFSATEGAGVEG